MARFARIIDDVVIEVADLPDGVSVTDVFPADLGFVAVAPAVIPGMVRAGDDFVAPSSTPAADPAILLAYAADKRWRREVGGITIGGVPVATDDRSKIMIMGARDAAAADPDWTTVWHGSDGQTYPLNATAMIAISAAVEGHVNASFAAFAAVKAQIDAGSITTTGQVDQAWG